MTVDYDALVDRMNAGEVSTEMLEAVLTDYHGGSRAVAREQKLITIFVLMTKLVQVGMWEGTWEWFRENIEPPTHYAADDQGNWDLLYKYSEENIGMVDIRAGNFEGYSRLCCTPEPERFWAIYTKWDGPIEWSYTAPN